MQQNFQLLAFTLSVVSFTSTVLFAEVSPKEAALSLIPFLEQYERKLSNTPSYSYEIKGTNEYHLANGEVRKTTIEGLVASKNDRYYVYFCMGDESDKDYKRWQTLIDDKFVTFTDNKSVLEKNFYEDSIRKNEILLENSIFIDSDIYFYPIFGKYFDEIKVSDSLQKIINHHNYYINSRIEIIGKNIFEFIPSEHWTPEKIFLPQFKLVVNSKNQFTNFSFFENEVLYQNIDLEYDALGFPDKILFLSYKEDSSLQRTRILEKFNVKYGDEVSDQYFSEAYLRSKINNNNVMYIEKNGNIEEISYIMNGEIISKEVIIAAQIAKLDRKSNSTENLIVSSWSLQQFLLSNKYTVIGLISVFIILLLKLNSKKRGLS